MYQQLIAICATPCIVMATAGERLKLARKAAGYRSASAFALDHDIPDGTYRSYENGTRNITTDVAKELAPKLGCTWLWLTENMGDPPKPRDGPAPDDLGPRNFRPSPRAPEFSGPGDLIPVMGAGEGGEDGEMQFNGEIIDRVPRPPFVANAIGAYAVYAIGMSMEPRYHAGELLYIHPNKPVVVGAYVLVQLRPRVEGDPPRAIIARLDRRTADRLVLGKLNPPRQITVARKDVVSVHRIVGSGEG